MNSQQRMLYALLFMATFFIATSFSNAHADTTPATYKWGYNSDKGRIDVSDDITSACAAYGAWHAPRNGWTFIAVNSTQNNNNGTGLCSIRVNAGGTIQNTNPDQVLAHQPTCPYGGSLTGTYPNHSCVDVPSCVSPEVRQPDGSCSAPPPPACIEGRILDEGRYQSDTVPIGCIQGCQALKVSTGAPELSCGFADGFGSCNYVYPGKYVDTGAQCNPELAPKDAPPPQPNCPQCDCFKAAKSWGEVNGVGMCVPRGTPGSDPVKTPLSPPKIETNTPAPTPENPNPAPVETITPPPIFTIKPPAVGSPPDTPPEVTETTTNADGSSSTVTTGLDAFCEANPNNRLCKSGSGAGGGEQDFGKFCEENPNSLACAQLGDVPEPDQIGTTEINIQNITLSPLPGTGTCPPPLTASIGGYPILIEFDWLCQYASAFYPLVVAAAWLSAAFIVLGGRKD